MCVCVCVVTACLWTLTPGFETKIYRDNFRSNSTCKSNLIIGLLLKELLLSNSLENPLMVYIQTPEPEIN